MRVTETSAQELIVRTPWWKVALFIIFFTVIFAVIYFVLSLYTPVNGIHDSSNSHISFATCLYFSIVTESTLGDGNITPLGISRACVSCQVMVGLVVAGMLVAKIVSARSSILVKLSEMAEGDWVDCVTDQDGNTVLGRTWIQAEQTGLCFQGTDFHESGMPAASFISHSIAFSKSKASFKFQSFEFTNKVFSEGVSTLEFSDIDKNGRFTKYSIKIADRSIPIFSGSGYRLELTPLRDRLKTREDCPEDAIRELREFYDRHLRKE